jgi:hypothetical protein
MLYATQRTEASPMTLIVVGALFTFIGLAVLFVKSRGIEIVGGFVTTALTLLGLLILLLGITLLLSG